MSRFTIIMRSRTFGSDAMAVYRTSIMVRLAIIGYHQWPEAPDDVAFLRSKHRHIFHIECIKKVVGLNREIEIILFKNDIRKHLESSYLNHLDGLDFGNKSCEMIASDLVFHFGLSECRVLEDGENGATVIN